MLDEIIDFTFPSYKLYKLFYIIALTDQGHPIRPAVPVTRAIDDGTQ